MGNLEIGNYLESFVEWLSLTGAPFFNQLSYFIENIVEKAQQGLLAIHPVIFTFLLVILSYMIKSKDMKRTRFTKIGLKKHFGFPLFCLCGMLLIWWLGFWKDTISTLVLVLVSTLIILFIGIPLGIWAAKSNKANACFRPVLDFMQTMPAFVYLIPAILFFSVGNVPGVIATVIFSLPPAVRLTSLGIRSVSKEVVEAASAFGSTKRQILFKVQIPLAMPTILAGVNQVIMLALSMVVISSMVGAGGLGEKVYASILQADIALGFEAGICIVIIAIILDRMTQSMGENSKVNH